MMISSFITEFQVCFTIVIQIWSAVSSSGLPSTRETWTYWRESSERWL